MDRKTWFLFPLAAGAAAMVVLLSGCPAKSQQSAEEPVETAAPTAPAEPAVILLTGFEPFGRDRPANPSWEGIRPLDGKPLHNYRLVARQMKVQWGQPREQLDGWIRELKPVAIFSFGQGGGFTIESRGSNRRGNGQDNAGARPPSALIVENGPDELASTAPCDALAAALEKKGYPITVSKNAGRYLCEETVYTLEHLKTKYPLETVLFCHVPPLGATVGGQKTDAARVTAFVTDVLEAWHAMQHGGASGPAGEPGETPAERQAVETFIRRYFSTWSSQDMKGYGGCFLPGAVVQFIDNDGDITPLALEPFLASQVESHRNAPQPMTETPESIDIRFEGRLARAVVAWKLTAGSRVETGYDHFTLVKRSGQWRIVNLTFYATKR